LIKNPVQEFHLCKLQYLSGLGGYTGSALFNLTRSKELLLRWAEYAAFTPLMRTHEGNQPASNHQASGASHRILKKYSVF
jgi:alpha-glucosidase (family GH31 glycosyl hydrolase)